MQFITLTDVLDKTALTYSTLNRLIKNQEFPDKVHLGGTLYLWDRHEVEGWMEQRMLDRTEVSVTI